MTDTGRYLSICFVFFSFAWLAVPAHAGGISLGATRAIYLSDKQQISLTVSNSDEQAPNLIQSWISDKDNKKTSEFIVTPPLFIIQPKRENALRIIHVGAPLSQTQETLFWINVKAIPATDKVQTQSELQLAVVNRIKLFYRPIGLKTKPEDALALLRFHRQGAQLFIENPSAYYLTLVNLKLGSSALPNTMLPPHSKVSLAASTNSGERVTFQTINDYGALTPVSKSLLQ
ncbi:fimbria/pilus periplasmic chaperone [Pseudomonas chlororaphis]|uniref:fimbria/pilus periplasmic chaperone n=1 Tax=Pseudomonas chlororaphis TaxID=587753 RepID=UPI000BE28E6C|nr:fimbria/pilus periplasmic chaperone [Pseudomonas chlororaphis]